jgi:hypothetical protein
VDGCHSKSNGTDLVDQAVAWCIARSWLPPVPRRQDSRYGGHEPPAWSVTSSPGKGPNRFGRRQFGIGSVPAD